MHSIYMQEIGYQYLKYKLVLLSLSIIYMYDGLIEFYLSKEVNLIFLRCEDLQISLRTSCLCCGQDIRFNNISRCSNLIVYQIFLKFVIVFDK